MRLVVFTQGVSPILAPLMERFDVVAIIESAPRGWFPGMNVDKALSRYSDVNNIPYRLFYKGGAEGIVEFVRELEPDLGVVYSMSQLLPLSLLEVFPRGVINCHPALLPCYRGPNPIFWAMFDGCEKVGWTIHYLDKGEDTGDVILQHEVPVEWHLGFDIHLAMRKCLVDVLMLAMDQISGGNVRRWRQPAQSPTRRAGILTEDAGKTILQDVRLPVGKLIVFLDNFAGKLDFSCLGIRMNLGRLRISGYVETGDDSPSEGIGRMTLTATGFRLQAVNGFIMFSYAGSLRRCMLGLFRKFMRSFFC